MRDGDAHVVLAALVEKLGGLLVNVLLRFVDVEVKRRPVFGGQGRAGHGRLGDERDEKPPEHGRTFGLEQVFRGVDDDDLAVLHRAEQVDLVLFVAEHLFKNGIGQDAQQARDDLLSGFAVGGSEKLGFKKAARDVVESFDHVFELLAVLHEIVKRENGRLRYRQHGAGQIGEYHALLLGEFRAQQRRKNIAVKF